MAKEKRRKEKRTEKRLFSYTHGRGSLRESSVSISDELPHALRSHNRPERYQVGKVTSVLVWDGWAPALLVRRIPFAAAAAMVVTPAIAEGRRLLEGNAKEQEREREREMEAGGG